MLKPASIFAAVLVAEMGHKTQLATVLFASDRTLNPFMVFIAAASALVLSSGIAVVAGSLASRYLETMPLKMIAGIDFIAIGVWTLFDHYRGA
jgi:putative Ca2+/H+ antiporter (TMEM165/GDT1 family)